MGSQSGLQGKRPAAAAVLGISPAAELSLLGSQMHTSNRWACHPCFNRVSATSRTAVYGSVRTVVWEGRSCEAPPYPDRSGFVPWPFASFRCHAISRPLSGKSRHRAAGATAASVENDPQETFRLQALVSLLRDEEAEGRACFEFAYLGRWSMCSGLDGQGSAMQAVDDRSRT